MDPKPATSPSTSPNSSSSSSTNSSTNKPNSSPPTPTSTTVNNAYPTTFIQANAHSFKHVVQLLTGAPESASRKPANPIPPVSKPTKNNKLYERRNSMKNLKLISPLIPSFGTGREEPISPSVLNFPSLVLDSPVYRSPRGSGEAPKLLPLFPLTSPRMESARETSM